MDDVNGTPAVNGFLVEIRTQRRYVWIFIKAHGPFPHDCVFCGEVVDGHTTPRDRLAAVIHHLNGDHENNDPSNLAPAHNGCHVSYHVSGERNPFYGKKLTPEHRAKIATAHWARSPEMRAQVVARVSAAHRGKTLSLEHRAKIAAGLRGREVSPETGAKIAAATKGRKFTPEHRAKISAANRARSPEARAKLSEARKGKRHTPEARAKMSAALKGHAVSAETAAKISAAKMGHGVSAETRAKISATLRGKTKRPNSTPQRPGYRDYEQE